MMSAGPMRVAAYRPYATRRPGRSWTLRARRPAATMAIASTIEPAKLQPESDLLAFSAVALEYVGSSTTSAESAETMMTTCSLWELPIHGTRTKLVASDPTIAPTVLAA